jgi:type IV secretory pathway VirB9-like protein
VRGYAILGLIMLASCAKSLPPPVALPIPTPEPIVEEPAPVLPLAEPIPVDRSRTYAVIPTIEGAMQQARRTPAPAQFSRGLLRYPFEQPSPIYRLDVAVDTFSTIVLAPGEQLYYAGVADTKRWTWDETVAGDGETRRTVFLIKPHADKLRTTILLTTSLGMYHLEAFAHKTSYVAAVAWKHPDRPVLAKPPPLPSNTRYQMRVMTTPAPAWTPTSSWDNGKHLFVRMADALEVTTTPAVYVCREGAEAEIVNHGVKGTTYVVHRLLAPGEWLELRSGTEDDHSLQMVRVERMEKTHEAP